MNIQPGFRRNRPIKKSGATVSVICWTFVFGMLFGYIVGLWHQAAQKQHRIETGLEENTRITKTYYKRGQK